MASKVLYLGDTDIAMQASYLAGVMSHYGMAYDYVASSETIAATELAGYDAYILSDYPASAMSPEAFTAICERVDAGAGFLMIGGWESFNSIYGRYGGSAVADILPVEMMSKDDRLNSPYPWFIRSAAEHRIVEGMDFNSDMPAVAGLNRLKVKAGGELVLEAVQCRGRSVAGNTVFTAGESLPLLVCGMFGRGRTAALACDLAPHWAGGFVDWGDERIDACAPGGDAVQIGDKYAGFVKSLISWISKSKTETTENRN